MLLCTYDSEEDRGRPINTDNSSISNRWGAGWSCQGSKLSDVEAEDEMPEFHAEKMPGMASVDDDDWRTCNDEVSVDRPGGSREDQQTGKAPDGINEEVSTASSSKSAPGPTTVALFQNRGGWPERLMSALPGDGKDLSQSQFKGSRCTAKDPFWVYSTATPEPQKREQVQKSLPMHCLHDAVAAVDVTSEVEIPDSELMMVQLRTREQRLDWRDFLCEAVAGRKAATLFQLFDAEAEPPCYQRPPPSSLTADSINRWYRDSGSRRIVPCVAPTGAGYCTATSSRTLPIPRPKSLPKEKILPEEEALSNVSRATPACWSEPGQPSRPASADTAAISTVSEHDGAAAIKEEVLPKTEEASCVDTATAVASSAEPNVAEAAVRRPDQETARVEGMEVPHSGANSSEKA